MSLESWNFSMQGENARSPMRSGRTFVFPIILLIVGLTNLISCGEDISSKELSSDNASNFLEPGDHVRKLKMGEQQRTYLVHIPDGHDSKTPMPVVLALHGAGMNGSLMVWFCGLNKTSDANDFIVVYPSGTGAGPLLTWNAGGLIGKLHEGRVDDVAFIGALLDDLAMVVSVDDKRVYACGMSNGGMMCYRLAIEMSDRIAAIAAVGGTMATDESEPKRPIPVMHLHGTKDAIIPYGPPFGKIPPFIRLKGVEDTVDTWVRLDGCNNTPQTDMLSKDGDKTKVTRKTYCGGKNGAEVVLVTIEGGGHTWPGRQLPVAFLGKAAKNISANDLIWEFFQKHSLE